VIERFAAGVKVLQDTCPGLVMEIDRGNLDTPRVYAILEEALKPMLAEGIDTVVLGCTHFPFVIPAIETIVGSEVRVIDPSPAVARQVQRLLVANNLRNTESEKDQVQYLTTGDTDRLETLLPLLPGNPGEVKTLAWDRGNLE
jgi:glutamate racemase